MADDPEPSEASPEGTHFALTATITVSPIDAGTTIEVNVDDVVARFDDGAPIAVAISQPQTIRIDDRGEPDSVVIAAADSTGGFFYIVDMLFPAIPPDVESEGDTWPISFEADVPAGSGTATYEGTGELVRFEDVGGVEAAVIRNDLTFTYDITMHASEVAALSGLGAASSGTADVTGTGEMTLTGWVDRTTGRVLRTEFEGTYDTVFTRASTPRRSTSKGTTHPEGRSRVRPNSAKAEHRAAGSGREERLEARGLVLELAKRRTGKRLEGFEDDASALDAPDACDDAVDQERLRHVAVRLDHRLPVGLGEDAGPVREREQHVVPLGEEANRRDRVRIGDRRPRHVEELATAFVAEAPERLESLERPIDLGHVHHAPLDDVAARRRSERREVTLKHLGARLGRVVTFRLLDRDESSVGDRAPERRLVMMEHVTRDSAVSPGTTRVAPSAHGSARPMPGPRRPSPGRPPRAPGSPAPGAAPGSSHGKFVALIAERSTP